MKERVLLERRQDARYGRFALTLGLAAAALVHLALFWVPTDKYQPFLEVAKLRRAVAAKPFRGKSPPRPAPPVPRPPEPAKPLPEPKTPAPESAPTQVAPPQVETPPPAPVTETAAAAPAAAPREQGHAPAGVERSESAAPSRAAAAPAPQTGVGRPSKDSWSAVLADLASRGKSLAGKPQPGGGRGRGRGRGGGERARGNRVKAGQARGEGRDGRRGERRVRRGPGPPNPYHGGVLPPVTLG